MSSYHYLVNIANVIITSLNFFRTVLNWGIFLGQIGLSSKKKKKEVHPFSAQHGPPIFFQDAKDGVGRTGENIWDWDSYRRSWAALRFTVILLASDSQAVCISISNTILMVDVKFSGEFSMSDPRLFIAACWLCVTS